MSKPTIVLKEVDTPEPQGLTTEETTVPEEVKDIKICGPTTDDITVLHAVEDTRSLNTE